MMFRNLGVILILLSCLGGGAASSYAQTSKVDGINSDKTLTISKKIAKKSRVLDNTAEVLIRAKTFFYDTYDGRKKINRGGRRLVNLLAVKKNGEFSRWYKSLVGKNSASWQNRIKWVKKNIGRPLKLLRYADKAYLLGRAIGSRDWLEATAQVAGTIANFTADRLVSGAGFAVCGKIATGIAVATAGSGAALSVGSFIACGVGVVIVSAVISDKAGEFVENKVRSGFGRREEGLFGRRQTYKGDIDIRVNVGKVDTSATGKSSAVSDVGVARGGDATVNVRVRSPIVTRAEGRSDAYAGVGVVTGDGGKVDVRVGGPVVTTAKNRATARNEIGVSSGGKSTVRIGGGVNATATGTGIASNVVGKSERGNTTVRIGGSVNAISSGSGSAQNVIGENANVRVGGSVTTIGRGGTSSATNIGKGTTAAVSGSVLTKGGTTDIGGSCVARRNGRCCVAIHLRLCALRVVPPNKHGCPPRYRFSQGRCWLFSDYKHRIEK